MPDAKLTHLSPTGAARMVDVGHKPATRRTAIAEGFVTLQLATVRAIRSGRVPKGEVLSTARIAGILAAKRCGEMIPLCHPLPTESVEVDFKLLKDRVRIESVARITARTGVEMEALSAVTVAALTIYDMCKAIDKTMVIEGVRLRKKTK